MSEHKQRDQWLFDSEDTAKDCLAAVINRLQYIGNGIEMQYDIWPDQDTAIGYCVELRCKTVRDMEIVGALVNMFCMARGLWGRIPRGDLT